LPNGKPWRCGLWHARKSFLKPATQVFNLKVSPFFKIEEIKPDDVETYAQALANLVAVVLAPNPQPMTS
jgi:hypothetical protein